MGEEQSRAPVSSAAAGKKQAGTALAQPAMSAAVEQEAAAAAAEAAAAIADRKSKLEAATQAAGLKGKVLTDKQAAQNSVSKSYKGAKGKLQQIAVTETILFRLHNVQKAYAGIMEAQNILFAVRPSTAGGSLGYKVEFSGNLQWLMKMPQFTAAIEAFMTALREAAEQQFAIHAETDWEDISVSAGGQRARSNPRPPVIADLQLHKYTPGAAAAAGVARVTAYLQAMESEYCQELHSGRTALIELQDMSGPGVSHISASGHSKHCTWSVSAWSDKDVFACWAALLVQC